MKDWLAVIPLKQEPDRKTRLAGWLTDEQRRQLSRLMFDHVAGVLARVKAVREVALLSETRPEGWSGRLFADRRRGLNAELAAVADECGSSPLLVIHADLPLVSEADVTALLAAAERGYALAPDRHGTGTNALALRDPAGFSFAFGPGSFARHCAADRPRPVAVLRRGLSLDIDAPQDLNEARKLAHPPSLFEGLPIDQLGGSAAIPGG